MSTHWGVDILFLLFPPSGVRCSTWFPDILGNSSYPIFTKFGMQVYWGNSLYGIAFGISSKFSTHRVSKECTLCNFQKIFPSPKMAKHKFASISLTVRDRAISSKVSSHRVSEHRTLGNFQKIFPSPKMAAILNFRIFAKNGKTQISFYLLNHAR